MYLISNGTFPKAKFYPKDARNDPQSIVVLLKNEMPNAKAFICPSLPSQICDRGLCFLWNDEFSGKDPAAVPDGGNKWVMVEICAADHKIPAPHRGGYHILNADGNVSWIDKSPPIKPTGSAPGKYTLYSKKESGNLTTRAHLCGGLSAFISPISGE
jgi:hypothetical protein